MKHLRVTEIISKFSGIHKIPKKNLDRAAERGTRVHGYIEASLNSWEIECYDEEIKNYLNSFRKFIENKKSLLESNEKHIERRLYSDEMGLTGQIDLIVKTPKTTHLYDWKTSSKAQKSWQLQAAAYQKLAEIDGFENVKVQFIHLQKDGSEAVTVECEDYEKSWDIFKKCMEIYRWFES